jgi:hemolysin III
MAFNELFVADELELAEHYPNHVEKAADGIVHGVGLIAAAIGAGALFTVSLGKGGVSLASATALYGLCLIVMLACSAVYNLTRPSPARRILRRIDEAAIFLMIAGSCTPFTSQLLPPALAIGVTSALWAASVAGAIGKIAFPRISDAAWSMVYVAFGWIAALSFLPLIHGLPMATLLLLALSGLIYSGGVLIYLNHAAPFRRAIWHALVLAGASAHFGAVLVGLVLR